MGSGEGGLCVLSATSGQATVVGAEVHPIHFSFILNKRV